MCKWNAALLHCHLNKLPNWNRRWSKNLNHVKRSGTCKYTTDKLKTPFGNCHCHFFTPHISIHVHVFKMEIMSKNILKKNKLKHILYIVYNAYIDPVWICKSCSVGGCGREMELEMISSLYVDGDKI